MHRSKPQPHQPVDPQQFIDVITSAEPEVRDRSVDELCGGADAGGPARGLRANRPVPAAGGEPL